MHFAGTTRLVLITIIQWYFYIQLTDAPIFVQTWIWCSNREPLCSECYCHFLITYTVPSITGIVAPEYLLSIGAELVFHYLRPLISLNTVKLHINMYMNNRSTTFTECCCFDFRHQWTIESDWNYASDWHGGCHVTCSPLFTFVADVTTGWQAYVAWLMMGRIIGPNRIYFTSVAASWV